MLRFTAQQLTAIFAIIGLLGAAEFAFLPYDRQVPGTVHVIECSPPLFGSAPDRDEAGDADRLVLEAICERAGSDRLQGAAVSGLLTVTLLTLGLVLLRPPTSAEIAKYWEFMPKFRPGSAGERRALEARVRSRRAPVEKQTEDGSRPPPEPPPVRRRYSP